MRATNFPYTALSCQKLDCWTSRVQYFNSCVELRHHQLLISHYVVSSNLACGITTIVEGKARLLFLAERVGRFRQHEPHCMHDLRLSKPQRPSLRQWIHQASKDGPDSVSPPQAPEKGRTR